MKIPREDTTRTRGKLLVAAGEIFAEKGFRDATIAEICRQAGTNIAAVNYHFGSKEALYREAWREVFAESIAGPSSGRGCSRDRAAGRASAGAGHRHGAADGRQEQPGVQFLVPGICQPHRPPGRGHQRTAPPPATAHQAAGPRTSRALGRRTGGPFLRDGHHQPVYESIGRPRQPGQQNGGKDDPRRIDDVKAYARHVVAFSLAGIAAFRRTAEARRAKGKTEGSGRKEN